MSPHSKAQTRHMKMILYSGKKRLESGDARNIRQPENRDKSLVCSHPRPDCGDHGVRELTSTSCLTSLVSAQTLASAIVSGPRSAHSSQGQHWDQLGVRRLMPFPTTFLLSPVVKCASKSKVNDNSQNLSVS